MEKTWKIFFLKNHTQNVAEKLLPDPFLKNQNWSTTWNLSLFCMSRSRTTKIYWVFISITSYKAFLKNKKRSGTSLLTSFRGWLKVGLSSSRQNSFICFNESPLKMMKNAFYFIWKALFVLKIFKFFSWVFGYIEKTAWLER